MNSLSLYIYSPDLPDGVARVNLDAFFFLDASTDPPTLRIRTVDVTQDGGVKITVQP